MKPLIALTMGDPGGIGPEVLVKTLQRSRGSEKLLVIGTPEPFQLLKSRFNLVFPRSRENLYFLDVSLHAAALARRFAGRGRDAAFRPGQLSLSNAAAAYAALEVAARLAREGRIQGLVTAPVNKTAMRLIQKDFHGHTEFLAEKAGAKSHAMMFVSSRLVVTLVTIHVALRDVSALVKKREVLEKIRLTHAFLRKHFRISKPRLAVCALNPHGRETGTEDEREIRPAVLAARRAGIHAAGPFSADQLFHEAYERGYDAVISMYHDQGLAPFKMIAFRDGVNVTLGLPYVRTSPDHGTAFDIAYRNQADPASMQSALRLAAAFAAGRKPF